MKYLMPKFVLLLAVSFFITVPVKANDEGQEIVNRATITVGDIMENKNFSDAQTYLKEAKAVLIIPEMIKAGFIIGGSTGNGVLLDKVASGGWGMPKFYNLSSGSIGLQIGVESSEIVFFIMTQDGLNALLEDKFTFGGDASVTVGAIGAGIEGSTTSNAGKDIIAFAESKGLFGGGALEGAVLTAKPDFSGDVTDLIAILNRYNY